MMVLGLAAADVVVEVVMAVIIIVVEPGSSVVNYWCRKKLIMIGVLLDFQYCFQKAMMEATGEKTSRLIITAPAERKM